MNSFSTTRDDGVRTADVADNHSAPRNVASAREARTRLDALVRRAVERLDALVSDERFQSFRVRSGVALDATANVSDPRDLRDSSNFSVSFVVKLGSATLTLDEAASLDLESIVPLADASRDVVQIWGNGRLCGTGSLLVSRGKLAVKIEKIDPDAAFDDSFNAPRRRSDARASAQFAVPADRPTSALHFSVDAPKFR